MRIHYTGLQALEEEFEKPYFRRLSEIIEVERSKFAVYPSVEEVWSWTTRAPIQDTRVVILGKAWRDAVVVIRVVIPGEAGIHTKHQISHPS
jgi:uracil DNA glycosylase